MRSRTAAIVVGVTTTAALAILCVRGVYLRWFSDDYSWVAIMKLHGFWGCQAVWYRIWSGRFFSTFALVAFVSTGPRTIAVLVTLTTLGLAGALRAAHLRWPLALAMTSAILLGTSDVPQSVLWQTGLFSYTIPLVAFAWWLGNAAGRKEWRWYDFIVPLASAGCSETGAVAQLAVCAIAFAAWRRKPMLAAFLVSLISLVIMAAAPGNAARKALYPPMPPLLHVIGTTAGDAAAFFIGTFARVGMMLLLVFLAAALFAPSVSRRLLIVAVLCAIACIFVTFAPAEAILSRSLPERAWIVPYAFLVAAVTAFGAAMPWRERWRSPLAIALVITALTTVIPTVQMARDIPRARAFARGWDRFDAFLRASRGREVFVDGAPTTVGTLVFLSHDPIDNAFMAQSYGLRTLVGMPPFHDTRLMIGPLPKDALRYRFDDSSR